MLKGFLCVNKDTQIAQYLEHRSIMQITEEHRTLAELNLKSLSIVDVDKFVYIHYPTDDDLEFRSDMNVLRNLLDSAFFHIDSAIFILVDAQDPLLEDLIMSAVRDSKLPRDKIEVIFHSGALMLGDTSKYISGTSSGEGSSSSYKEVFVREADSEEKDRYLNKSAGLDTVLPALTDMTALYKQRAHVESVSAGRVITEVAERPETVTDFTRVSAPVNSTYPLFVVSGERWTNSYKSVYYLINYSRIVGTRILIVNTDSEVNLEEGLEECTVLTLEGIQSIGTPSSPVALLNVRFNQLGFVVEFLHNILGVEEIIFNVSEQDFQQMATFAGQLSGEVYDIYVAHYNESSVMRFLDLGIKCSALFLCFKSLSNPEFDVRQYRKQLKGMVVATFPEGDVDVVEFRDFCLGSSSGGDKDE